MSQRNILTIFVTILLSCMQVCLAETDYSIINEQRVIAQNTIPVYSYKIIKTYPHDPTSFTEGLVFDNGYLYESTGLDGQSKLRKMDLSSGKVLQEYRLPEQYFAEGITILNNKIYQLTYISNIGFIYNKNNFQLEKTFSYTGQGWGLTNNGQQLIMSNGSANLIFLNPKTLQIEKQIIAHDNKGKVNLLNELEYIDGKIYANVWQTNYIAIISPKDGKILGWIDLTNLKPKPQGTYYPLELNGIAYDPQTKNIIVTGKDWNHLYAIQLVLIPR